MLARWKTFQRQCIWWWSSSIATSHEIGQALVLLIWSTRIPFVHISVVQMFMFASSIEFNNFLFVFLFFWFGLIFKISFLRFFLCHFTYSVGAANRRNIILWCYFTIARMEYIGSHWEKCTDNVQVNKQHSIEQHIVVCVNVYVCDVWSGEKQLECTKRCFDSVFFLCIFHKPRANTFLCSSFVFIEYSLLFFRGSSFDFEIIFCFMFRFLVHRVRVQCSENYYNTTCTTFCRPRNDQFGHYTCGDKGDKVCLAGWQGANCEKGKCFASDWTTHTQ